MRSNAPIKNIVWSNGQPCAFYNQKNVQKTGSVTPEYYPLEKVSNLDECEKLDNRYIDSSTRLSPLPN